VTGSTFEDDDLVGIASIRDLVGALVSAKFVIEQLEKLHHRAD